MLRAGALPRLESGMQNIAGMLPADYMLSIPPIHLHHRKLIAFLILDVDNLINSPATQATDDLR